MRYFIKTFGCQQNTADSEKIAAFLASKGMTPSEDYKHADYVVINTCMIRQSAENRAYGLIINLKKIKTSRKKRLKIIVTGCLAGLAHKDRSGKILASLMERFPEVDEFVPIEEVGIGETPVRQDQSNALVPISSGCNNYCSYCVVPYTRGKEISRPYNDIIGECRKLRQKGYKRITLLGQNVNSYGADIRKSKTKKPIYVKHLGKLRIPTLFPHLLHEISQMGFDMVDFLSSNPWDFSKELIEVIANNKNISRTIHLPVQSGNNTVLKKMNRWYTKGQYLKLVKQLKLRIENLKLTTDIIVGFPGETEKQFQNTVELCREVDFEKAYISLYSPRPLTASTRLMKDDIPYSVKKRRWQILENLINKAHL